MGIIESTFVMLFRWSSPVKKTEEQHQKRTAAILRPIIDQAAEVADCLIDNEPKKANDTKAPATKR